MIEVTYDGKNGLTVQGHAEAGAKGKDLVCAAVTSLTLALGKNCKMSAYMDGRAVLGGGSEEIFKAFAKGYEMLANFFPDCVHYECKTEEKEQK